MRPERDPPQVAVVHPGWVRSINDGDWHWIGFTRLCHLYRLDPRSTINAQTRGYPHGFDLSNARHYFPHPQGRYPD